MTLLSSQKIRSILDDPRLDLRGIHFSDEMIRQLQEFCRLLLKWNAKINLISEHDPISVLEKHVFDSLQYLRWLQPTQKIIDVGSGAGFPGLPIKILFPDVEVTLLESQRKRCSFLREMGRELGLNQFSVAEGRAEEFPRQEIFKNQFDRVLFRGFSSLEACLTIGSPFLKAEGQIILMKNPDEEADLADGPSSGLRLLDKLLVKGFQGKDSLMMVIENCST